MKAKNSISGNIVTSNASDVMSGERKQHLQRNELIKVFVLAVGLSSLALSIYTTARLHESAGRLNAAKIKMLEERTGDNAQEWAQIKAFNGLIDHLHTEADKLPVLAALNVLSLMGFIGIYAWTSRRPGSEMITEPPAQVISATSNNDGLLPSSTLILNNSSEIICTISPSGTILTMNAACTSVLGYAPEDLCGKSFSDLCSNREELEFATNLGTVARLQLKWAFEAQVIRSDQQIVDMHWSASWSPDLGAIFCVARDITAQKLLEKQRLELEHAREELTAIVSHDIRSPLMSLELLINNLLEKRLEVDTELGQQMLKGSSREIDRLILLVSDILDTQSFAAGKLRIQKSRTSIADIVERSVAAVSALALRKGITIVEAGDSADCVVDGERMVQVIVNLLTNAIKFSPAHSEVKVATTISTSSFMLRVSDRGLGVAEKDRSKLFSRFPNIQVSSATEAEMLDDTIEEGSVRLAMHLAPSTGLGLAICKDIVEQHGGKLWYERTDSGESLFIAEVPLSS